MQMRPTYKRNNKRLRKFIPSEYVRNVNACQSLLKKTPKGMLKLEMLKPLTNLYLTNNTTTLAKLS